MRKRLPKRINNIACELLNSYIYSSSSTNNGRSLSMAPYPTIKQLKVISTTIDQSNLDS